MLDPDAIYDYVSHNRRPSSFELIATQFGGDTPELRMTLQNMVNGHRLHEQRKGIYVALAPISFSDALPNAQVVTMSDSATLEAIQHRLMEVMADEAYTSVDQLTDVANVGTGGSTFSFGVPLRNGSTITITGSIR